MKRTIPAAVAAAYPDLPSHPTIQEVFQPGTGWRPLTDFPEFLDQYTAMRVLKRITPGFGRRMARVGITAAALNVGPNRIADFRIADLTR